MKASEATASAASAAARAIRRAASQFLREKVPRRFFTNVAGKIKKLAGGAAGAGRRWLRRLRSQTQALTAQEATFEGRGEREEISLRQCVLRDHQIRIGSGLFIHSAST